MSSSGLHAPTPDTRCITGGRTDGLWLKRYGIVTPCTIEVTEHKKQFGPGCITVSCSRATERKLKLVPATDRPKARQNMF